MKNSKRILNTLGLIAFIASIIGWGIMKIYFDNTKKNNLESYKKLMIKGKVIKTYADLSNKNAFTVLIKNLNGEVLEITNFHLKGVYTSSVFNVGDSIVKDSGTIKIKVYKNDSLKFESN